MIEEAERRGLTVYWGIKGLSIRAKAPNGQLQTLWYCYPPGSDGWPTARVEGYVDTALRGTEMGQEFVDDLMAIPGFKKGGQYTMRLAFTADTLPSIAQALEVVWKTAEAMSE